MFVQLTWDDTNTIAPEKVTSLNAKIVFIPIDPILFQNGGGGNILHKW